MSYTMEDIEAAKAEISAAVSDVIFDETDYGWGLRAHLGIRGCVVFQPEREDFQRERISDPLWVIAFLKGE